ncbi:MAG: DEAD/DEAH box helicase family protein [Candidatus Aenigmatarchaeota archaeon]
MLSVPKVVLGRSFLYNNILVVEAKEKDLYGTLFFVGGEYGLEDILHTFTYKGKNYYVLPSSLSSYLSSVYPIVKTKNPKEVEQRFLQENVLPRSWQSLAIEKIISENKNRGIIKMPTGAGKTIFSLLLANKLGQRAVIIVDRITILEQWEEAISKVFSGAKVKYLSSENLEKDILEENDFLLTSVQLLLNLIKTKYEQTVKLFDQSLYNMLIYDEAHTTSAAVMFGKSISLFPNFKYVYGLTATPYVSRFPLHFHTIGNVIVDPKDVGYKNDYAKNLQIDFLVTDLKPKMRKWPGMTEQYLRSGYQTAIESNEKFLEEIEKLIKKLIKQGRKILLVVSRIKTTKILSKVFPSAKILTSQKRDEISIDDNLIIATYGVAQKGIDFPQIDTLISTVFIYGKVSTVQLVGRIVRSFPNKQTPLVILAYDKLAESIWGNIKDIVKDNLERNFKR